MIALEEYLNADGESRFRAWFNELDVAAATKITVALERMAQGNKSSIEGVGEGVSEYKVNFGPGYRIYFGKDGEQLVILLGGGAKKRQSEDIDFAKAAWREYKQRKKAAQKDAIAKGLAKKKQRTKLNLKRK